MIPTGLNLQEQSRYAEEGYLSGISIATAEEALRYRKLFDELEMREGKEKAQIGLLDRHFDQPFIWELATHSGILDCVEGLLGPDFLLLATHFFCKYGQDTKFVAWHQDVTYWGLEPPLALTVWYAVDDSDRENGCMRVLPGTHHGGIRGHGKAEAAGNLLSVNQEAPVSPEETARATDLELKAGSVSIHDGALIHGSLPNLSARRRCGLTLRYVPTYVRPVALNSQGKHWNAVLARGADRFHHFGERAAPFSAE